MTTKATKAKPAGVPLLITHTDLAERLGIPTRTLLRWARGGLEGFPPPVRVVARTYVFNRRQVEAWFRLQGQGGLGAGPTPD